MGIHILTETVTEQLFSSARTYSHWLDEPVPEILLKKIYSLMKFGPTSMNASPLRILYLVSDEAKARLKPALMEGNVEQTMSAPVTVIFAQDMEFYEKLPVLFPYMDAKGYFEGNDDLIRETAMRNSSLQAAYFMLAARSYGLDCGPMSGFNVEKVNEEFFKGTPVQVNFLCNIGYGDDSKLNDRSPRLTFDEACQIL